MVLGERTFTAADTIAKAFVSARQDGRGIESYPGPAPQSLADAYQVQAAAIDLMGEPVGGWKIGRINPPLDARFGANRLVGPIFAPAIVDGTAADPDMPVFVQGFAAAEAEYLLRIGSLPPARDGDYGPADAAEFVDAVHIGIEIASSPYPSINADGPAVTVSDFGNNNGLVIGGAIADWDRQDINAWPVELIINDQVIGTGSGAAMLDGPFGAAAFLFNLAAARGIALAPGQWISSGAVTGVHPVEVGDRVTATFKGDRSVSCRIAAY